MQLSDLIIRLTKMLTDHGDMPVDMVVEADAGYQVEEEVVDVAFSKRELRTKLLPRDF